MVYIDPPAHFDVAVVGAGQAGLAIGYFLACQGRRFVILEAAGTIGSAWRNRWKSLVLFTPRRYDSLPGLAFPGRGDGYPGRDEVIAYLERYVETFALPIEFNAAVESLAMRDDRFVLELDGRSLTAAQVVVATGPFQVPRIPRFASDLAPGVFQTHSSGYREPSGIPPGTVLVVGGGNTGYQIATELAVSHRVVLAVGGRQRPLPQSILGRDLFWWLETVGLLNVTADSALGRRLRHRDVLIGSSPRALRRAGVEIKPRLTGVSANVALFADGSQLTVDAVIWATGFGLDVSWIHLPITNQDGSIRQHRGVTGVSGLYFLGLPWQHTRGSALLGWVKDDAAYLTERIAGSGAPALAEQPARAEHTARAGHPAPVRAGGAANAAGGHAARNPAGWSPQPQSEGDPT